MADRARLPDFLVIGAMKAGTTSLEDYLTQHPQIFMCPVKEPNFFAFEGEELGFVDAFGRPSRLNRRSVTDLASYEELFREAQPGQMKGDVSHWYLYDPRAAQRIKDRVPDVKLIAVLRDPVERAFSEFLFHMRDERESATSFREALDLEAERIEAGCDEGRYVERGLYHAQLERYFALFPPDRIRVYLFEDLRDDVAGLVHDLFEFLGVDPDVSLDLSMTRNVSGIPKNRTIQRMLQSIVWNEGLREGLKRTRLGRPLQRLYAAASRGNLERPKLELELRTRLRAAFRNDTLELQALIGRDLSRWLDG